MTPEGYDALKKQLVRFDWEKYDPEVDLHLPPDPAGTTSGTGQQQPKFVNKSKGYYRAQCAFRGLRVGGNISQLQSNLKLRDKSNDAKIKQELDAIQAKIIEEDNRREAVKAEIWWNEPTRTWRELYLKDGPRALKQQLDKETILKTSCVVFCGVSDLCAAARQLGLECHFGSAPRTYNSNPQALRTMVQVIGQKSAVRKKVKEIEKERDAELRQQKRERLKAEKEQKAAEKAAQQAAKAAEKERQRSEKEHSAAWDPTGHWRIAASGRFYHMDIYRDDFAIPVSSTAPSSAPKPESARSLIEAEGYDDEEEEEDEDEDEEEDEEEDEDSETDYSGMNDHESEWHTFTAGSKSTSQDKKSDTNKVELSRFGATFCFGAVKGVLRIYPTTPKLDEQGNFHIKNNRTFDFIWRGCETGEEGQIQLGTEKLVHKITFSNRGRALKGTFQCPINGKMTFSGQKVQPGLGKKGSSAMSWSDYSAAEHGRQSRSRWGKWSW